MAAWQSRNFLIAIKLLRDKVTSFSEYPFGIPAIGGLVRLRHAVSRRAAF